MLTTQNTNTLLTSLAKFLVEAAHYARALAGPQSAESARAAIQQEAAVQESLREAFVLRDFSVARDPLKRVAEKLGIQLPEWNTESAKLLAYEATRILLNASEERARCARGDFLTPSPYFNSAMSAPDPISSVAPFHAYDTFYAPLPTSGRTPETGCPGHSVSQAGHPQDRANEPQASCPTQSTPTPEDAPADGGSLPSSTPENPGQPAHPAVRDLLEKRKVLSKCTDKMIMLFEKREQLTVADAFDLYIALKSAGFPDDWEKGQKADLYAGKKWEKSSAPSIVIGQKIWSDYLGDTPLAEISEEQIDSTVVRIREIPNLHGKGPKLRAEYYDALIEKVHTRDRAEMDAIERKMRADGCKNEEDITAARFAARTPRLRVNTYVRLVRLVNLVGKMLLGLGIIQNNPFSNCTFTNREERALKKSENSITHKRRDDRFFDFLQTPVFQGSANDPLFWLPLMAYLMGGRFEEPAQLKTEDVQREKGIDYLSINDAMDNTVKSSSGIRKIPIHPAS